MRDKKGIQMAITTVMMIILSITVLAILIVFFNSQTGFLSKWFKTQQTQSNVDVVIGACDGLVISGSVYAYCCETKEVVFGRPGKIDEDGKVIIEKSVKLKCVEVAEAAWATGRVGKMDCPADICGV